MGNVLSNFDIVVRLFLGVIAGGIIGFERSFRRQAAGLRTHILISLGATSLMLLSIKLPQQFNTGDPGRIAAQVVSGIGFLGAGAIIRLGNNIKGLTTAASLWITAAIGLVIGSGMYIIAGVAVILTLITLVFLGQLKNKFFPEMQIKFIDLFYKHDSRHDDDNISNILKKFNITSRLVNITEGVGKKKYTKVRLLVYIPKTTDTNKLMRQIKSSGKIVCIEIKEKF